MNPNQNKTDWMENEAFLTRIRDIFGHNDIDELFPSFDSRKNANLFCQIVAEEAVKDLAGQNRILAERVLELQSRDGLIVIK